jgi:hypothetical protein
MSQQDGDSLETQPAANTEKVELLPCPFCGIMPVETWVRGYALVHPKTDCILHELLVVSEEDWNERKIPSVPSGTAAGAAPGKPDAISSETLGGIAADAQGEQPVGASVDEKLRKALSDFVNEAQSIGASHPHLAAYVYHKPEHWLAARLALATASSPSDDTKRLDWLENKFRKANQASIISKMTDGRPKFKCSSGFHCRQSHRRKSNEREGKDFRRHASTTLKWHYSPCKA